MKEIDSKGCMLAFYQRYGVAPVRQDIGNLDEHFARRQTLYQQLGIPKSGFAARRILEIGPGTGQNALFIAAQSPMELVLVEPNSAGQKEIERSFSPFPTWHERVTLRQIPIEQFTDHTGFDFVLCEGLVGASGHPNPSALLTSIASHVKPGGILVLTCIDYVAYLSEMLRRVLAFDIVGHVQDLEQKTALLVPVFAPHLNSLSGTTRRFDDWVIDNLINPASIGQLVSFTDCVDFLSDSFDVVATSPRFIADWTWYKKAVLEEDFFNRTAVESYWRNVHNFMDYRYLCPERPSDDNRALMEICSNIHQQIREYEQTGDRIRRTDILREMMLLRDAISFNMPSVQAAIEEFCCWLDVSVVEPEVVAESRDFGTWFGRGQTYISFVRHSR